ncbi:hypothetical protein [Sporosarcina trichiuri]|uniref:hypothetical protein n=1 Tax=Sporosarcina trichiuri TaxID=3056445 RepID=UPI0025B2E639|nr:hypothetical protein [Sporosarcina sp. 0.2-SM1T-5]WJY27437.1 hypothetical protein QWT68_15570 [Sporosarcina sp. 0.2-SM1T-5]WJY27457.1 hypothetical protein QWT68_00090 [Sporosarcina sp. 0.2-SM1T-5]
MMTIAQKKQQTKELLDDLKQKQKAARKDKDEKEAARLQDLIYQEQVRVDKYRVSVKPVRFKNGHVVNGALIDQYRKKLPKTGELTAYFEEGPEVPRLLVLAHSTGKIALVDWSEHFDSVKLPEGEDLLERLGIVLTETRQVHRES